MMAANMNPKFQASVQTREDVTYVKLSGVIDEDNELGTLADKLGTGTAVIDVSEIERINSCGVRDWVNWLSKAEKGGAKIVLVECSPAIVAQINLVNNFTGQGVVKSFYAPYFCPNCDLEKVLLVETRDMAGMSPFKAPSCRCDECDGPMDFDDMEESYFAFLSNTKKIVTDARVDSVINEFTPTDGDRKIRPRSSGGTNPGSKSGVGSSSGAGSLPSIPSLPNIKQTVGGSGTGPGGTLSSVSGINGFGGGSSASGVRSSAAAALAELEARRAQNAPAPMQPGGSSKLWVVVVIVLLVAIGLLGFVLFGGKH
jgi:anti-anti-sigma regulatory factor